MEESTRNSPREDRRRYPAEPPDMRRDRSDTGTGRRLRVRDSVTLERHCSLAAADSSKRRVGRRRTRQSSDDQRSFSPDVHHKTASNRKRRSRSRRRSSERHRSHSDNSHRKRRRTRDDRDLSFEFEREKRKERRYRRERKRRDRRRRSSTTSLSTKSTPPPPPHLEPHRSIGNRTGVVSDDDDRSHSRPVGLVASRVTASRKLREKQSLERSSRRSKEATKSTPKNDTVGHFNGNTGTIIADRFKILREVGLGTFGRVVECLNLKRDRRIEKPFVALKIVRKVKRYHDSALIEADIIDAVNRRGGRGLTHCVILHDAFSFQGHFCLVFESLGPSLYDALKKHDYKPFPMVCVQDFAIQLLEVLDFLHGECGIVHTDLKIENILLMNDREVMYENQLVPESTRLKLIDFGGACYDCDKKSSVINTRQYRAPEVILGTGWSMPSDIWSIGCILAELYKGELLFATHLNIEHLALIDRIVGPFPRRMVKSAKTMGTQMDLANEAFDSDGRHRMQQVLPDENVSFIKKSRRLNHLIRSRDTWFFDLLSKMLVIDPSERATAHECLQFLSSVRRNEVRCC